jgi:hypothetical protein
MLTEVYYSLHDENEDDPDFPTGLNMQFTKHDDENIITVKISDDENKELFPLFSIKANAFRKILQKFID